MKTPRAAIVSLVFLLLTAFSFGLNGHAAAATANSEPTATPAPTPDRHDPSTLKRPTPTPTPSVSPTPRPVTVQTLDDLQANIRRRMNSVDVRRGRVGIKVVSLATGKVIFENDADKYFMPASNMKVFTVATAMERLTPDYRFVTSVYAAERPDAGGTVKGDLRVFGRGDVSISTAFNDGDYYKGLDRLVEQIKAAGVKRIDGALVGDESYFRGFAIPPTWEWDDLQPYYGAEVSALPINDNAVDLTVLPGSSGNQCIARIAPANTIIQLVNRCRTSLAGSKSDLSIFKRLGQNVVEISGSVPAGGRGFKGSVAITHPAELFVALLKQRLEEKGIAVKGPAHVLDPQLTEPVRPAQVEIARLESPPFALIAAKTLKPSQNMFTETILWTLGEWARSRSGGNTRESSAESSQLGLAEVKNFITSIGVPADGIMQYDGSGLSRHDLISPSAVVAVYTYMAKQSRYSQAWRDSLTIGGVDGTLSKRFTGTAAAGNMRGKTGTIDQVSALSGYLTTAAGEPVVLSIVVNGVAETRTRTSLIDDIVVNLANFNGKLDQ